jgi:carbamoyl-phosphate synthase large subunit
MPCPPLPFSCSDKTVAHELENATDLRVFYIATAFEKGWSVDKVHELTRIDRCVPCLE